MSNIRLFNFREIQCYDKNAPNFFQLLYSSTYSIRVEYNLLLLATNNNNKIFINGNFQIEIYYTYIKTIIFQGDFTGP